MARRKWISWAGSLVVVVALAGAALAFRPQPIKKHPGGTHVFRAVEAETGLALGCQTFAAITAQPVPAEGTETCCSDCGQVDPCAGGGNGSIAQYVGGRWTCSGGGAPAGVFNVTDFGAKCDGTTDDTVAIQTAIDAAVGHCTIATSTSCVQDDDCPAAETCVKTQGIVQLPAAICKVGGAKHCSYSTGASCTISTDCPKHCASPDDPDICTVGGDCLGGSCVDYETCTTALVVKPGVTFRGVRGFADGAGGSIVKGTQGTGDAVVSLHRKLRDNDVFASPFSIKDMTIRNGDFLIDSLDHTTFVVLEDLALSSSVGAQIHLQGCNEEWYVRNVQISGGNPGFGSEDTIIPDSLCAGTLFDKSSFENVRFTGGTNAINVDFALSTSVNWTNTIFNFTTQDFVVATGGITNWVWMNTNSEGLGFFSTEDTYAKGDMTASSAQLDNLGSCSEDATKNCNVDSDCTGTCQEPLGQCSATTSTSCRVDSECPATETCTAAFAVGDTVTVRGVAANGRDLTTTVLSLCGTGPRTCVNLNATAGLTVSNTEATDTLYSGIKLTDTHAGGTAPSNWTFIGGSYGADATNVSARYAVDISKGAVMRFYGTTASRPVYDPNQSAIVIGGATVLRQPSDLAVGNSTFQSTVIPGGVSPSVSEAPRTFIPSPPGKDIVLGLRDSLGSGTGTFGKVTMCQFDSSRRCTWESRATSPLLNDIGSTWIRGPLIYNGSSFANLGTPGNGMTIWCQDCERTDPCRAGGSGAMAKRLNGRWACDGGGTPAGVFNVTDFGAKCDGATDDTVAIQAAINGACAAGGGVVRVPVGICVLATAITTLCSKLTLEGVVRGGSILKFTKDISSSSCLNEGDDAMINWTTASSDIVVRDLTLTSNVTTADFIGNCRGHNALRLVNVDNVQIDNVEATNWAGRAIFLEDGLGPIVRHSYFHDTFSDGLTIRGGINVLVENNRFEDIFPEDTDGDGIFDNEFADGVLVQGSGTRGSQNILIQNNVARNILRVAYDSDGTNTFHNRDVSFIGNMAENAGRGCASVENPPSGECGAAVWIELTDGDAVVAGLNSEDSKAGIVTSEHLESLVVSGGNITLSDAPLATGEPSAHYGGISTAAKNILIEGVAFNQNGTANNGNHILQVTGGAGQTVVNFQGNAVDAKAIGRLFRFDSVAGIDVRIADNTFVNADIIAGATAMVFPGSGAAESLNSLVMEGNTFQDMSMATAGATFWQLTANPPNGLTNIGNLRVTDNVFRSAASDFVLFDTSAVSDMVIEGNAISLPDSPPTGGEDVFVEGSAAQIALITGNKWHSQTQAKVRVDNPLAELVVTDNVFSGASAREIRLVNGAKIRIADNRSVGATTEMVNISGGTVSQVEITGNIVNAAALMANTTGTDVRAFDNFVAGSFEGGDAITFAKLSTETLGAGSQVYCSDCERTDPCQNGHCSITTSTTCSATSDCPATETCVLGTGAIAKRLNGAWVCN